MNLLRLSVSLGLRVDHWNIAARTDARGAASFRLFDLRHGELTIHLIGIELHLVAGFGRLASTIAASAMPSSL